jgi:Zn finger protein HypA/HybF involved in hydrogenase expression
MNTEHVLIATRDRMLKKERHVLIAEHYLDKEKEIMAYKTRLVCNECNHRFNKTIGANTSEVKCPKCGGYDTEPAGLF